MTIQSKKPVTLFCFYIYLNLPYPFIFVFSLSLTLNISSMRAVTLNLPPCHRRPEENAEPDCL